MPDQELRLSGDEERCLECETVVTGRFCTDCGAEQRTPLRPLRQWLRDMAGQLSDLDIRLLRTLPRLLFFPGWLTVEYAAGRQRRYTSPLRLYVVASAIIIAVMNLLGVFQLDAYLAQLSEEQQAALAAAVGADLTDPGVGERFGRRMDLIFPIVNLVTPIGLTLAVKLVYLRRYLHEHLVFTCHFSTFFVVVWLPILFVEGGAVVIVATLTAALSAVYLLLAMRRVYRGRWGGLIARFVVVSIVLFLIVMMGSALSFFMALAAI